MKYAKEFNEFIDKYGLGTLNLQKFPNWHILAEKGTPYAKLTTREKGLISKTMLHVHNKNHEWGVYLEEFNDEELNYFVKLIIKYASSRISTDTIEKINEIAVKQIDKEIAALEAKKAKLQRKPIDELAEKYGSITIEEINKLPELTTITANAKTNPPAKEVKPEFKKEK